MKARIRDTELYFDIDGAGLALDGTALREKPVAFVIHGGPGGDHSGFRGPLAPLAEKLQLVYFDHRDVVRHDLVSAIIRAYDRVSAPGVGLRRVDRGDSAASGAPSA